jgi:mRNA interferase YafQ
MPLTSKTTGRFEKSVKLMRGRGKDMSKLRRIMEKLIDEKPLEPKHRDHNLVGNYVGCRECHVEPDWLLVYTVGDDWIGAIPFLVETAEAFPVRHADFSC